MTDKVSVRKIHMGAYFTEIDGREYIKMSGDSWYVFIGDRVIPGGWPRKWLAEWEAQKIDPDFVVTSAPRNW